VLVVVALGDDARSQAGSARPNGGRRVRYSAIAQRLSGVSHKMLTQTLRTLERDGLVVRSAIATVPVTSPIG
jgi:DNA-binding HxlR family transcriptional regulator